MKSPRCATAPEIMSYTPRFRIVIALAALFLLLPLQPVEAADIRVGDKYNCPLDRAISSAVYNVQQTGTNCAIGDSDKEDTIILPRDRTVKVPYNTFILASIINGSVTIEGNGSTIDYSSNKGHFFTVYSTGTLTLKNVTITNAKNLGAGGRDGSAISVAGGTVILNNSRITGNAAARNGGSIYVAGGEVTLNNSTVSDNTAGSNGGGIYVASGSLTLNKSTVSGNTASTGGGGILVAGGTVILNNSKVTDNTITHQTANGGGIYVAGGSLTLNKKSTVAENKASGNLSNGGGISITSGSLTLNNSWIKENEGARGGGLSSARGSPLPTVTITGSAISNNRALFAGGIVTYVTTNIENSTISGNRSTQANGFGAGGIHVSNGTTTLTHVTVVGNSSTEAEHGGIYKYEDATLNVYNSLSAGNTGNNAAGDCGLSDSNSGLAQDVGNFIGENFCGGSSEEDDPRLGRLTGSPPPYHPLASGSPARDAAAAAHCLETDQRGRTRPYGEFCDIGAFEWHPSPPAKKGSRRTVVPTPAVSTCLTLARVAVTGLSESTQCQRVDAILNGIQGSIDAVDVWGWVLPNTQVCFEASGGSFKFLDTSAMPRTMSDLSAFSLNGMTCAVINGPGIVVLLPGDAPPARVGQSAAPPSSRALSGCMVMTDYMLRFRDGPGGEIIMSMVDPWGYPMNGFLPPSVTLTALERTADWFKVDYHGTQGWVSAGHVSPQGACG